MLTALARSTNQSSKRLLCVGWTGLTARKSLICAFSTSLQRKTKHSPQKFIRNLDASRIHPEDYINLEGRACLGIQFASSQATSENATVQLPHSAASNRFPIDQGGFLYFYEDHKRQPHRSGLRFRICSEATQESFDGGHDLMVSPTMGTWRCSLLSLALAPISKYRRHLILQKLRDDGFLDWDNLQRWARCFQGIPANVWYLSYNEHRILTSLDEPFEVDLESRGYPYYVVNLDQEQLLFFWFSATTDRRRVDGKFLVSLPYKGRCLLRLENIHQKATGPDTQTVTCNVRVVKLLTEIECKIPNYDGRISVPEEGSLIKRGGSPVFKTINFHRGLPSVKLSVKLSEGLVTTRAGFQISTLDPAKLCSKDFIDMSNRTRIVVRMPANVTNTKHLHHMAPSLGDRKFVCLHAMPVPFPAGTHGFLYWYHDSSLHPITGEVRFRVASGPSMAKFGRGHDLVFPGADRPWSLPLLQISNIAAHTPLVTQALRDGLITEELVETCLRIGQSNVLPRSGPILYHSNQPFTLDFSSGHPFISIVDPDACVVWHLLITTFIFRRPLSWRPLTGKCVFQLEPAPLDHQRPETGPSFNLRTIKILQPFRYPASSGIVYSPQEGSLVVRSGKPLVLTARRRQPTGRPLPTMTHLALADINEQASVDQLDQ